jgi:hypothetical protein
MVHGTLGDFSLNYRSGVKYPNPGANMNIEYSLEQKFGVNFIMIIFNTTLSSESFLPTPFIF